MTQHREHLHAPNTSPSLRSACLKPPGLPDAQILNRYFTPQRPPSAKEIVDLELKREMRLLTGPHGQGWYSERVRTLVLRRGFERHGYVLCPQPGCETPVCVADVAPAQRRVDCPRCAHVYCRACRQAHHYATRCEDLMTLRRLWLECRRDGRQRCLHTAYSMRYHDIKRTPAKVDRRRFWSPS